MARDASRQVIGRLPFVEGPQAVDVGQHQEHGRTPPVGRGSEMIADGGQRLPVDLAGRARGGRDPQHHVGLCGILDQGLERLAAGEPRAVDEQRRRQALVGKLVGGEALGCRQGVDLGLDRVGQRVDQARLARPGLARHQDAHGLGLARLGGSQVRARGRRDVRVELRGGDTQVAAVKVDGRAADLPDVGARQPRAMCSRPRS